MESGAAPTVSVDYRLIEELDSAEGRHNAPRAIDGPTANELILGNCVA